MAQITGRALKVGDKVRAAKSSLNPFGHDRETFNMDGVIVEVLARASSGARKQGSKPHGKVRVKWASGSVGVHDSTMIIKVY